LTTDAREHVTDIVTIDGCRLEYRWLGASAHDTPAIVFLHEGLGSITQWRDFPSELCTRTGFRGVVFNRQGYGRSDSFASLPVTFMHREALNVLPQLLDALEIVRPILFGHSDGGSIALIYAGSAHPSPPAALILEAPHVFVEDLTVASIAALRDSYASTGLRERLARHHDKDVDRLFTLWTDTWLSDEFRGWNIERYLSNITCPTLVVQGRDDEYGTMKQVEAIARSVKDGVETLALDNCGHAPHVDCRDAVLEASVAFLQRMRATP
jgi:pimeloyl-ACP methyl ester carboxylesterase